MTAVEDALTAELDAEPVTPKRRAKQAAELPTIFERMVAILSELPPIGKTQKNVQQGFMFRGQDDMLNALNPLFAKHGVFVIPDVVERIAEQRTTAKGSIMFEINLHVRFTAFGIGGDSVSGSAWGEGTDMGDKATSKAMTMAFKYWLNEAFAISTAEAADPTRETPSESTRRERAGAPRTPRQPETTPDPVLASADDLAAYKAEVEDAGFEWAAAFAALGDGDVTADTLATHRQQLIEHLATLAEKAAL